MKDGYEKLIRRLCTPSPPAHLLGAVLLRIRYEQRRLRARNVFLFSFATGVSLLALIPTLPIAIADFSQSGLGKIFSLLVSEPGTVVTFWQDFSLSILESLPAVSLILTLSIVLVFLASLRSLLNNISRMPVKPSLSH